MINMKTLLTIFIVLSTLCSFAQDITSGNGLSLGERTIRSISLPDSTQVAPIREIVLKDYIITDPKTGKVVARKEHGKEWIVYDPKRAVEILMMELKSKEPQTIRWSNTLPYSITPN